MTDLRSGPACSMLLSASRTSRVPELQWPLGKGSESGSRELAGKQGDALENRADEEEEDDGDDDEGGSEK